MSKYSLPPNATPEEVIIELQEGETRKSVDAQVSKDHILIGDDELPVRKGDLVRHRRTSGVIDEYEVEGVEETSRYAALLLHIGPVDEQKSDSPSNSIDEVHIQGDNARINQGSVDRSINVASSDFDSIITECREVVQSEVDDEAEREELEQRLTELEQAQKELESGDGALSSVREAYLRVVAIAANHAGLFSFLWSLPRTLG